MQTNGKKVRESPRIESTYIYIGGKHFLLNKDPTIFL